MRSSPVGVATVPRRQYGDWLGMTAPDPGCSGWRRAGGQNRRRRQPRSLAGHWVDDLVVGKQPSTPGSLLTRGAGVLVPRPPPVCDREGSRAGRDCDIDQSVVLLGSAVGLRLSW